VREILYAADAEAHDRVAELRIVRRDDDVARPREHESAGDALALHGGDRRLGDVAPALGKADVDLPFARHLRLGARAREAAPRADRPELAHVLVLVLLAQVVTGREVRAVGGKDD